MRYLGNIITESTIRADPQKTSALRDYPQPRNEKELRMFLGTCGVYRKFCRRYSDIINPLYRLLKNGAKWDFSDECVEAFNRIREIITSDQVLALPDLNRPFRVSCDSSFTSAAAVLSQIGADNIERPVAFWGRALTQAERNFTVTEVEALSLLGAIKEWHVYLCNQKFHVFTDHMAVSYINKIKSAQGRLLRWSLVLQSYDFEISHRLGRLNIVPDALSRRSYDKDSDITKIPETMNTDAFMPIHTTTDREQETPTENYEQTGETCEIVFEYENEQGQTVADIRANSDHVIPAIFALDDVGKAQRESAELIDLYTYLQTGDLPTCDKTARRVVMESDQFTLDGGILYHLYQPRQKNAQRVRNIIRQTVIPEALRGEILHAMHGNLNHFGVDRTYATMILRFWWKNCYADTLDYVRKCVVCQKSKNHVHFHAHLRPIETTETFGTWHMDFLKLSETKEGYKYALLFVDSFSKWCECFPTKNQNMETVADILFSEIVCRYGAMRRLISDLGASLRSKLVEELCKRMNIKRTYTTAFRPQTNAHCERTNSVIINLLKTHISAQTEWPKYLPGVLGAMRSTVNTRSSQFSAYQLLFGKEMPLAVDVVLKTPSVCSRIAADYITDLNDRLRVASDVARENIAAAQLTTKRFYDRKARDPNLKIGQRVLVFEPKVPLGHSPKLRAKFEGPYYLEQSTQTA